MMPIFATSRVDFMSMWSSGASVKQLALIIRFSHVEGESNSARLSIEVTGDSPWVRSDRTRLRIPDASRHEMRVFIPP